MSIVVAWAPQGRYGRALTLSRFPESAMDFSQNLALGLKEQRVEDTVASCFRVYPQFEARITRQDCASLLGRRC